MEFLRNLIFSLKGREKKGTIAEVVENFFRLLKIIFHSNFQKGCMLYSILNAHLIITGLFDSRHPSVHPFRVRSIWCWWWLMFLENKGKFRPLGALARAHLGSVNFRASSRSSCSISGSTLQGMHTGKAPWKDPEILGPPCFLTLGKRTREKETRSE